MKVVAHYSQPLHAQTYPGTGRLVICAKTATAGCSMALMAGLQRERAGSTVTVCCCVLEFCSFFIFFVSVLLKIFRRSYLTVRAALVSSLDFLTPSRTTTQRLLASIGTPLYYGHVPRSMPCVKCCGCCLCRVFPRLNRVMIRRRLDSSERMWLLPSYSSTTSLVPRQD